MPVESAVPSWEEMVEASEAEAYKDLDAAFEIIGQQAEAPVGFGKKLVNWVKKKITSPIGSAIDKVKKKIPFTFKTLLKFIGRSVLLAVMIWQLADGARGYAQTGLMISLVTAESLSFGAWITRGILLHFWANRGVAKAVAGWLTRSAVVTNGDTSLKA